MTAFDAEKVLFLTPNINKLMAKTVAPSEMSLASSKILSSNENPIQEDAIGLNMKIATPIKVLAKTILKIRVTVCDEAI